MRKTTLFFILSAIAFSTSAQNQWRIGIKLGTAENHSSFNGGMTDAHSRFNHQPMGTGELGVVFRNQLNNHWSLQAGIQTGQIGFQFSIAEDYSFLKKNRNYSVNKVEKSITRVPLTAIYNSNYNCRNFRWFAGAGIAFVAGGKSLDEFNTTLQEENGKQANSSTILSQHAISHSYVSADGHIVLGFEKLYRSGRMLSLGLNFSRGMSEVARTTVNYTLDNKDYTHDFVNHGHYCGLSLTYYFKALKKKEAEKPEPQKEF